MSIIFDSHANFASSGIATAPSPATTGGWLIVSTGTGTSFPAAPFNCVVYPAATFPNKLNSEIVRITSIDGSNTDKFYITRQAEGSNARSITNTDLITLTVTSKSLTDIETALNDIKTTVDSLNSFPDLYEDLVNHRLGVNTASPAYTLDVTGDINFSGTLRYNGNAVTGTTPDITDLAGKIGIGNTTPVYLLDVSQIGNSLGSLTLGQSTAKSSGNGSNLILVGGTTSSGDGGSLILSGGDGSSTGGNITLTAGLGGGVSGQVIQSSSPGTKFTAMTSAGFGINTTTPAFDLDINGVIGNSSAGYLNYISLEDGSNNININTGSIIYLNRSDVKVRYLGGTGLQLYNSTTASWHTLGCTGSPAVLTLDGNLVSGDSAWVVSGDSIHSA